MTSERLQAIKKRFSRVLFMLGRSNGKMQLIQDINDLIESAEENKRLRDALEEYAALENYQRVDCGYETYENGTQEHLWEPSWVELDKGEKARKALKGDSND